MSNKVKFGLSEVHIAPITYSGSTVTYGTIFALPKFITRTSWRKR